MPASEGDHRLRKSIASLLDSGRFADAKIECDGQTFHVHKSVICTQSEYFSRAFDEKNGFKEANTSTIQLQEIEASTVRAIIEFMYHGDYKTTAEDNDLLLSIDVYAAAEMYQVGGLKEAATRHFKEVAPSMFDIPTFPDAIHAIYQSTMEEDRGLRDILVDTAVPQIHDLVKATKFNNTLVQNGEFGKDLVHAMNMKFEDDVLVTITCPGLGYPGCLGQENVKGALLRSGKPLLCNYCGNAAPYSRWFRVNH
ncbi:BTB/POZ protein [Phyllosticta citribraziliensis]|uniref:BTB/POZ protein n=1 Tax=Phyllosticta citribraziliensis TaxID=989973 RepID=A0ABR1LNQ8_9PEZI